VIRISVGHIVGVFVFGDDPEAGGGAELPPPSTGGRCDSSLNYSLFPAVPEQ
jgi:hypothetical protein